MAKNYHNVEPKVHPLTYIAIIGFLVISLTLILVLKPSNQEQIYAAYEKTATSDFTPDHPYFEVTYSGTLFHKGLDSILNSDEVVALYIGSPSCASCQKHIGAFEKYFYSEGFDAYVSKIYYIDASVDTKGLTELQTIYPNDINTTTPQFIVFKNGVIVATFVPESADNATTINRSVRDFYQEAETAIDNN